MRFGSPRNEMSDAKECENQRVTTVTAPSLMVASTPPSSFGRNDRPAEAISTTTESGAKKEEFGMRSVVPTVVVNKIRPFYDVCGCVDLVANDIVSTRTVKPVVMDAGLLEKSATLRYLYKGYFVYNENLPDDDVHRLVAYACKSPKSNRRYELYKTVTCVNGQSPTKLSDVPSPCGAEWESVFGAINQYLTVFSTLADFNFNLVTPQLKGGLCNVLVVHKIWTMAEDQRVVPVPHYRSLPGDRFTDTVLGEFRFLRKNAGPVRRVKFLSTTSTEVFCSRLILDSLADLHTKKQCYAVLPVDRTGEETHDSVFHSVSLEFSSRSGSKCPIQPPASSCGNTKRCLETGVQSEVGRKKVCDAHESTPSEMVCDNSTVSEETRQTSTTEPSTSTQKLQDYSKKEWKRERSTDTAEAAAVAKHRTVVKINPTLIVFKQSLEENDPDTLLCSITKEIDLSLHN